MQRIGKCLPIKTERQISLLKKGKLRTFVSLFNVTKNLQYSSEESEYKGMVRWI